MFMFEDVERAVAKIKVVGVGGGGGNTINSMIATQLTGIEFIAVNTDAQHLEISLAPMKIQIGADLTKGLGAGSNPVIGKQAALDDKELLMGCVDGADMVFITAGMGGGTGTGASPVIASLCKELGILTVAVVTRPFYYEGRKRGMQADEGLKELKRHVDTLIVIPNDRIHLVVEKGTPLLKSFSIANDVLRQAIQGISDVILRPGLINLDFADVKAIMERSGKAVIGMGIAKGNNSAREAAKKAILNPLIEESSIEGAHRILINITGGINMSFDVLNEVGALVHESSHDDANIIIGTVIDPDMEDELMVTVIATGLEDLSEKVQIKDVPKWQPKQKPLVLKGSDTILRKKINLPAREEIKEPVASIFVQEAQRLQQTELKQAEPQQTELKQAEPQQAEPQQAEPQQAEPQQAEPQQAEPNLNQSAIPPEDIYDVPAFLRKRL